MRARITNLSTIRRTAWVDCAFPVGGTQYDEEMDFVTTQGGRFRAVRAERLGNHSQMYKILVPLAGEQSIVGTLEPCEDPSKRPDFVASDWVSDDIHKLIPQVSLTVDGVRHTSDTVPKLSMVSFSKAHQTWKFQSRVGTSGFIMEAWLTIYSASDVMDFRGHIVWSDRDDPEHDKYIKRIILRTGEYSRLYFGLRNGHTEPPKYDGSGYVHLISDGDLGFVDGSAIPFSGVMCALPDSMGDGTLGPPPAPFASEKEKSDYDRVASFTAAMVAPVRAVCLDWDGSWLSHKWVPRNIRGSWQDAEASATRFSDMLRSPDHMYGHRYMAALPRPSSTGAQEDHGATKGSMAVSLGDPRWIFRAEQAIQADMFRGLMHFEEDGSTLKSADHRGWIVWDDYTHDRVASDKLGKRDRRWGDRKATGWYGYDDQHRSMNNLLAYYALTGDPMIKKYLEHRVQTDLAMHKNRMGAARAMGRLLLAWAHWYTLCDGDMKRDVHFLIEEKVNAMYAGRPGPRHNNPVKVLCTGTDPRMGVFNAAGEPLEAWVVWEHGLAAVGIYAAYKVMKDVDPTTAEKLKTILDETINTIIDYACFEEDGQWWIANNVWYPSSGTSDEGKPITFFGGTYTRHATYLNVSASQGGVVAWTLPAILIYIELAAPGPVRDKGLAIAQRFTEGMEATKWNHAEWWACVESVNP